VDIKIAKPLSEDQWAAGYTVELMVGPDATVGPYGGGIRQAYVELRANVGNGLDFKIGQWDNIIGFEGTDSYANLNWTRSYGYTIEPTEHVGLLAEYVFNPSVDFKVGVANDLTASFNRNVNSGSSVVPNAAGNAATFAGGAVESKKALVSLLTLTAPDSWGSLKGSALYAGLDYGPGNSFNHLRGSVASTTPGAPNLVVSAPGDHLVDKTHLYVGAVVTTPVTGLKFGAAWDTVNNMDAGAVEGYASTIAAYGSYKMDKLTINGRFEYAHGSAFDNMVVLGKAQEAKLMALTGTVQYDLWANVISRLEVRWDTSADGSPHFGGTVTGVPTKNNELMVAANIIYKF
jgi:hypothetical protein